MVSKLHPPQSIYSLVGVLRCQSKLEAAEPESGYESEGELSCNIVSHMYCRIACVFIQLLFIPPCITTHSQYVSTVYETLKLCLKKTRMRFELLRMNFLLFFFRQRKLTRTFFTIFLQGKQMSDVF